MWKTGIVCDGFCPEWVLSRMGYVCSDLCMDYGMVYVFGHKYYTTIFKHVGRITAAVEIKIISNDVAAQNDRQCLIWTQVRINRAQSERKMSLILMLYIWINRAIPLEKPAREKKQSTPVRMFFSVFYYSPALRKTPGIFGPPCALALSTILTTNNYLSEWTQSYLLKVIPLRPHCDLYNFSVVWTLHGYRVHTDMEFRSAFCLSS